MALEKLIANSYSSFNSVSHSIPCPICLR